MEYDEDAARSSLLHTFLWNRLPAYEECAGLFYNQKKDYEFVADFLKHHVTQEEDSLIQLWEYLANKDGFVTIEQRIAELIERKGRLHSDQIPTLVNELKTYFDKKINDNVYNLFNQ